MYFFAMFFLNHFRYFSGDILNRTRFRTEEFPQCIITSNAILSIREYPDPLGRVNSLRLSISESSQRIHWKTINLNSI